MRAKFKKRVRFIAAAVLVAALVLVGRLYVLQVMQGTEFRDRAEGQYVYGSTENFSRGTIFFTEKDGLNRDAATLDSGYTLALIPTEVEDAEALYTTLSEYIELDEETFLAKAHKEDDPYEEVARRVPNTVGDEIRAADFVGVRTFRERWRVYPGGVVAAHAVGFVGFGEDGRTVSGRYGLERFYDDVLTKEDTGLYVNFFAELFTNIKNQLFVSGDKPGANVVTSIEPTVQAFAEHILDTYGEDWNPDDSGIVILDPSTGQVVALAARPAFDPNNLAEADPVAFQNPIVEKVYEFGSIVKPLTIAAALDAGVITPETTYNDRGFAVYDGARISNFDGKGRGVVSMQEVLSQSLNTGVAFAVEKMGTDTFRDYFDRFALREETGIDLPNEVAPLVSNLDSPRMIEYVTASFGQGIAVSPIAMARALGALANHGEVPGPHIATELQYPGGLPKKLGWTPDRRAISKQSSEALTRMLVEVVDTALLDGTVKIPELTVAAKTGTAQIAKEGERGYYEDRFLHSFFGYFPAYEPQFLVFLYAVNPQGARYASETWTNPFMESVRFLVNYYDIQPDRLPAEIGVE